MTGEEKKVPLSSAAQKGQIIIYCNSGEKVLPTGHGMFISKRFSPAQITQIRAYLRDQAVKCRRLDRIFILIIKIDDTTVPIINEFRQQIPRLPLQLIDYVRGRETDSRNLAILPHYYPTHHELMYLLSHPYAVPSSIKHPAGAVMGFDSTEIRFWPVATWICPSSVLAVPEEEEDVPEEEKGVPMILLLVANADVPFRLGKHLGSHENAWRMKRLQRSPSWIYLDLAHVLGHWGDVWLRVQKELIRRDAQTHGEIEGPSVLQLTRQLHRDNANIVILRENLRLHIAALERFAQFVKRSQQSEPKLVAEEHQDEIHERMESLLGSLRNYQETSDVIMQQWKTLLSLTFNTETVSQGQRVALLNTLAFVFIPLSFASSLFSIQSFPVPLHWYPLWAAATLMIAVVAVYISRKVSISSFSCQCWKKRALTRHGPVGDEESQLINDSGYSSHIGAPKHIAISLHDTFGSAKKSQVNDNDGDSVIETEPAQILNSSKVPVAGETVSSKENGAVLPTVDMTLLSAALTHSSPLRSQDASIGSPLAPVPETENHGDTTGPIARIESSRTVEKVPSSKKHDDTGSGKQAKTFGTLALSATAFLQYARHELLNIRKIRPVPLLPAFRTEVIGEETSQKPSKHASKSPDITDGEPEYSGDTRNLETVTNRRFPYLTSYYDKFFPEASHKSANDYDEDLTYGDYYFVEAGNRGHQKSKAEETKRKERNGKKIKEPESSKKKKSKTKTVRIPDFPVGDYSRGSNWANHVRRGAGYQEQGIISQLAQSLF